MSVHAVHAGAERNVCNIVVSTETLQTTTNPSQTLLTKGQIIKWMRKMTPICTFVMQASHCPELDTRWTHDYENVQIRV